MLLTRRGAGVRDTRDVRVCVGKFREKGGGELANVLNVMNVTPGSSDRALGLNRGVTRNEQREVEP